MSVLPNKLEVNLSMQGERNRWYWEYEQKIKWNKGCLGFGHVQTLNLGFRLGCM